MLNLIVSESWSLCWKDIPSLGVRGSLRETHCETASPVLREGQRVRGGIKGGFQRGNTQACHESDSVGLEMMAYSELPKHFSCIDTATWHRLVLLTTLTVLHPALEIFTPVWLNEQFVSFSIKSHLLMLENRSNANVVGSTWFNYFV